MANGQYDEYTDSYAKGIRDDLSSLSSVQSDEKDGSDPSYVKFGVIQSHRLRDAIQYQDHNTLGVD